MENRIRLVWILSLASIFLLTGVQAYWLYNQYMLVLDDYSSEVATKIIAAGDKEYNLRRKERKMDFSFMMNSTAYTSGNDNTDNRLSFAFVYNDSLEDKLSGDKKLNDLITKIDSLNENIGSVESNSLADEVSGMKLVIDHKLPLDSIQFFAGKAATNIANPFKPERFDSLLHADIPGHRFRLLEWPTHDTLYTTRWKRVGGILHPAIQVYYTYSPFQKLGVTVETDIPTQPLFTRMAIQLLLAFGIVLLLLVCLIFQIQTILKQKKINELRKSFVNTMIHELKRPVQTLKTFIAFLGDKDMRSDEIITQQVVQDSMFELDNLSAYLGKLKDMVRADTEETLLNLQRFDLRELTGKVIRLIQLPADKRVEFSQSFEMDSSLIEADPIHLANVLSNLIENAIKYSGESVHVEIKAKRKGNALCLTVSDNGIGIPTVEQKRVFAKFYRGSNLPDPNIPGLGLGLSYVKLISEAHQGQVSLKSLLGEGTSVTLMLPQ